MIEDTDEEIERVLSTEASVPGDLGASGSWYADVFAYLEAL